MSGSVDPLTDIEGIPGFWELVETAEHTCLVLDYDGTLAPFHVDRMKAFPLDGVVELLTTIRDETRTHVAIMTGRPLRELLALLGDLDIPVSASQGSEFMYPDGRRETLVPSDRQRERLDRAEEEARVEAPHGRVERKIIGVALHTRGLDPKEGERIEQAVCNTWEADANQYGLDCRRFNGGIELRIKNVDKGTALNALLDGRPPESLCVYVGDDETDEDALLVIRGRGYGIKVGRPDVPTYAEGRLADPEAVRDFLRSWISVTRTA
jgi:trehalose 6-phosphate phosphatase